MRNFRVERRVWVILSAFVGIQMGWILRPFIGDPTLPPTFLRTGVWANAYVVILETLWYALTR